MCHLVCENALPAGHEQGASTVARLLCYKYNAACTIILGADSRSRMPGMPAQQRSTQCGEALSTCCAGKTRLRHGTCHILDGLVRPPAEGTQSCTPNSLDLQGNIASVVAGVLKSRAVCRPKVAVKQVKKPSGHRSSQQAFCKSCELYSRRHLELKPRSSGWQSVLHLDHFWHQHSVCFHSPLYRNAMDINIPEVRFSLLA